MATTATPRSIADVIRSLDAEGLTTLLVLRPDLAHPRPVSVAEIAERATGQASSRLAVEALDQWQLRVATALASFPDTVSLRHLAALLEADRSAVSGAIGHLRDRALAWGSDTDLRLVSAARAALGTHPAGLAAPSASPMDETTVAEILAQVGDDERAVLDRLVWESPVGRVQNATRQVDLATATSPVERLLARKLLRPWDDDHVVLPREVSLRLRGGRLFATKTPDRVPDWPAGAGSRIAEAAGLGTAVTVAAQALVLADEISRMAPRPLATGGISKRDQAALADTIGDHGTAALLVELLRHLRVITSSGAAWLPTTSYDTWAAGDGHTRWRSLVTAWTDLPDPTHMRRAAMRELRQAPVGATVAAATLLERMTWRHPLLPEAELQSFATSVLDQATRLGLVSMGVRTSLWEADTDPGFPAAGTTFVIQSDLTAVAPGPLTLDVGRVLDLVTERESPGPASVHRFTASSVRRALDAGWSTDRLLGWLDEHSSTALPQPLSYLVADVARQYGRIRVRPASAVITVDDETMAESVLRHPGASELGLHRLSSTLLATDAEPDEVIAVLRELGHAPVAEGLTGEPLQRPPARRLTTPGTSPAPRTPSRDELRALVNSLANPSAGAARAQSDLMTMLGEAQRAAEWLDIDYVDDQGRRRSATVRVLNLAGGQARLVQRAAGQFVVPLSRVVAARHTG